MSIGNINSNLPVQNVAATAATAKTSAPAQTANTPATDRLQLSGSSHLLAALKANDGVRTDKVAAIKAQITNGTYDESGKLDASLDKVLDDLNR